MRASLHVLAEELKRLKAAGVKTVVVSDESLRRLRDVAKSAQGSPAAVAKKNAQPPAPPAAAVATQPVGAAASEDEAGPRTAAREFAVKPIAPPGDPLPAPMPFELPSGDKAKRWAALRDRVLKDPVCCSKVRPGKQVVFGVGSLDAKIMFVGEAPGGEEEVQGEPFVGPAGQLLTKMISGMGLSRSDVYIGNIMNWRPDLPVDAGGVQYGNRPPSSEEMTYCLPFLKGQIEVVNPEVLVALGATAAHALLGEGAFKALGEVRGRWHTFAGKPLMVTYHPSYILRNQSNRSKRMVWEDLLKVMEKAGLPISEKQRGFYLDRA
jgi:uracil-DNA glycosylase family 4